MALSIFTVTADKGVDLETRIADDGGSYTKAAIDLSTKPTIKALSFGKVGAVDGKSKVAFFNKIGEMYSFRTQEIQEEIADLARVDYPSYVQLKRAFRENISLEVQKLMFESVQRFRQVGYTDEQALEMSKPVADALYKQLKLRFDTLFPNSGKVTKSVTEHL